MPATEKYEEIDNYSTETEKQSATLAGSITEGDRAQLSSETRKHPLDVHLLMAIRFGNTLMCDEGDDAEWPCAALGTVNYASAEECMAEDDYNGMMEMLYDEADECCERHPYFNSGSGPWRM